jgi:hypothetical protein
MKRALILPLTIMILAGLSIMWMPNAGAYERYHDPNKNDEGYCAECHPGFLNGELDTLHARHTGGTDPVTTNCLLCHTTAGGTDNPLTMWSGLDGGNGLGCAGCHGRDYGETVTANYGGFPTAGKPKASGYGLRKLHINIGETVCLACHPDVNQSFIKPEFVAPLNHARSDVGFGGEPLNPCDNEDSANDADSFGLDNDGDLMWDADDPDCSLIADTHVITESGGGQVNFELDAGPGNASRNYILLGTFSGTDPGFPLPGGLVVLPMNWDWFTDLEMTLLNSFFFTNFMGSLDVSGMATAQLNVPPLPPGTAGFSMHYAFCLNNPFNFASHSSAVFIWP